MNQVRIFALGGLDEDGKNMYVVEVNQSIFVIDAGLKYPDTSQHGIEMIIPDVRYLVENKNRVKAMFITHAHDDVMAAVPAVIKQLNIPIYTAPLTAAVIEEQFKKEGIKDYKIHRIRRNSEFEVAGSKILTFGVTQSVADGFGLAISTDSGYVVYTSEFIFDYDMKNEAFSCDITQLAEIGKKGVLALMSESVSSSKQGHTSPLHRITDFIEPYFEETKNRIIITSYAQNIFRLIEIIELANKYKKKIVFYDEQQRSILKKVEELGYYRVPIGLEVPKSKLNEYNEDVVVVISGTGNNLFKLMLRIAQKEDSILELDSEDTVIIASPIVPGTEKVAAKMENELYKEGCKVITLDRRKVLSMHASMEDIKMMMYLIRPKYYVPIKGEYQHLISNANVALDMGINASNIILLDNGQIANFIDGKCTDIATTIQLEDVVVAGKDNLDISGMILRDRETLATDGVIVVGVVLDHKTKRIIGGPDVQSRGVIYLKDADYIVKEIGNLIEKVIEDAVSERRYENIAIRTEVRDKIMKYVARETGKHPMVLPAIVEINVTE